MPTKTVGTNSRNYSTLQAAADSLPASLVTDGNSYILDLYNDSEFSASGNLLTLSGHTTDATHTITIKAATGQAWYEHADALTNRFAYDQSKGVGIKMTGTLNTAIINSIPNVTYDGLQVKCTNTNAQAFNANSTSSNVIVQRCIFHCQPASTQYGVKLFGSGVCKLLNSLVIIDTDTACSGVDLANASIAVNNTVVRPTNRTVGGTGIKSEYGTAVSRNNNIFGFTNASTGTFNADGHNCTDVATAPGTTSNLVSKSAANQFVNPSTASSTEDFKLKNISDCINAGVTDTTNIAAAIDAVGTSRPQGAAWDIGAWEFRIFPPTAVTMTGPSSGTTGVASSNFTVGTDNLVLAGNTVVVTPSDGGAGGTFTPTSVSLTSSTVTATFTYTPAVAGVSTISVTNDSGLTNPSSISYTAVSVPTAAIDNIAKNGQNVTYSGTTTGTPTSALATVPVGGTPNGAVEAGPSSVTLGTNTFTVTFSNMRPGNYAAPVITVTNAAGTTGATGGSAVTIVGISCNFQAT